MVRQPFIFFIALFIILSFKPAVNNIPAIIQQNTIVVPRSGCIISKPTIGSAYKPNGIKSCIVFNLPLQS